MRAPTRGAGAPSQGAPAPYVRTLQVFCPSVRSSIARLSLLTV